MAQDLAPDRFDIECLRHIATDAEAQRVSLAAAMIKLHALTIARSTPALRSEALEIVKYSEQLYANLPTRQSIGAIVAEHLAKPAPGRASLSAQAVDDLVAAIWDHLRKGRG